MKPIGVAVGMIAAATLLAACGGSDGGGATCGQVQPCGGSVLGTWTILSSCQTVTDFTQGMTCPGATLDESMKVESGSLTFNTDMRYVADTSQSGTMKFKIPLSCTPASSCDDFAASIVPAPPDATTVCASATNGVCDCTLVFSAPMVASDSGTFSSAGTVLTTTSDIGGTPIDSPYCVQGRVLHILTLNQTGAVDGDIVATKAD